MRIGIDARKIADFGIGTYIRGLLEALVALRSGDEFIAFAPSDAVIPEGVRHVAVDAPHYSLRELVAVGRAASRERLDVLHAPHYVVPFTRVPLVVTIHDLIHLHQPMRNPFARLYARVMLRRAITRARCVLTVSETVRHQLEEELGARDVVVTPNGIDVPPAYDAARPQSPFFLFVGNDKPHKNVDALVAAFTRLRETSDGVRLVLAGGAFTRFASTAHIACRGFVSNEELSELYRTCTALVMPSFEEGFGLPAAEAMAHAAPVISSTAAALVEITGDAALHVDPNDVEALAHAMRTLLEDEALRASLASKGRDRARTFTWKRCAEVTLRSYHAARNRGTSWNIGSKLRF